MSKIISNFLPPILTNNFIAILHSLIIQITFAYVERPLLGSIIDIYDEAGNCFH